MKIYYVVNLVSGRVETFPSNSHSWNIDMGVLFINNTLSMDECNPCVAAFAAGQWESLLEFDEPSTKLRVKIASFIQSVVS